MKNGEKTVNYSVTFCAVQRTLISLATVIRYHKWIEINCLAFDGTDPSVMSQPKAVKLAFAGFVSRPFISAKMSSRDSIYTILL